MILREFGLRMTVTGQASTQEGLEIKQTYLQMIIILLPKQSELDFYKAKVEEMENDIQILISDLKARPSDSNALITNVKFEYDTKISQLQQELSEYRLKYSKLEQNQLNNNEVESWKRRYMETEVRLKEFDQVAENLRSLQIEYDRLKLEYSSIMSQFSEMRISYERLQSDVSRYRGEYDRVNSLYMDQQRESESWKIKIKSLEGNSFELDQLRTRIRDLESTVRSKDTQLEEALRKSSQIEREVMQRLEMQFQDRLRSEITVIEKRSSGESERVISQLRSDLEQWKARCIQYESKLKGMVDYEQQITILQGRVRESEQGGFRVRELEEQVAYMRAQQKKMEEEFNRYLQVEISKVTTEYESQKRSYELRFQQMNDDKSKVKIKELESQIEQMNRDSNKFKLEIEERSKMRIRELEGYIEQLTRENSKFKLEFESVSRYDSVISDLERKLVEEQRLREQRQREFEEIIRKKDSQMGEFQQYGYEIKRKDQRIEELQLKLQQLVQATDEELKNRSRIELQLQDQIRQKEAQISEIRIQFQGASQEDIRRKDVKIKDLEDRLRQTVIFEEDSRRKDVRIRELEELLRSKDKQMQEIRIQISGSIEEESRRKDIKIRELEELLRSKDKQMQEIRIQISGTVEQESRRKDIKIMELEELLRNKDKQMQEVRIQISGTIEEESRRKDIQIRDLMEKLSLKDRQMQEIRIQISGSMEEDVKRKQLRIRELEEELRRKDISMQDIRIQISGTVEEESRRKDMQIRELSSKISILESELSVKDKRLAEYRSDQERITVNRTTIISEEIRIKEVQINELLSKISILELDYERLKNIRIEQESKIQRMIEQLTEYESKLNILQQENIRLENRLKSGGSGGMSQQVTEYRTYVSPVSHHLDVRKSRVYEDRSSRIAYDPISSGLREIKSSGQYQIVRSKQKKKKD